MNTRSIIESFDQWRSEGVALALVTVYETLGSTYTKAGHRIVVAADGRYSGLISGGCLEGDIAEHAARVLQSGSAAPLTYDMRDEVEDVFGLGVGCNGLIRVFLQPLLPQQNYEPFASLKDLYGAKDASFCATVIESPAGGLPAGSSFRRLPGGGYAALGAQADAARFAALMDGADRLAGADVRTARFVRRNEHGVLFAALLPIPRLLVLGAGLDAVPLVRMAVELGWYVDVVDHRPAYLERAEFAVADSRRLADPRQAADVLGGESVWDAAVVMSHHLDTDAAWLRALAPLRLGYLGVLGPPARREKLLERLEAEFPDLRRRLHGPIGLDIGGGSPAAIALSILAELQSVLAQR